MVRDLSTVVEETVADSPDVMKSLSPTHLMLLASTPDNDVPQSMFTPEIDHACMNHDGIMMMTIMRIIGKNRFMYPTLRQIM